MRYVYRCAANRWVFNVDLKLSMLSVGSRREYGNEFQTIGAATENDRRPNLLWRFRGTTSWCRLADSRRWRLETGKDWDAYPNDRGTSLLFPWAPFGFVQSGRLRSYCRSMTNYQLTINFVWPIRIVLHDQWKWNRMLWSGKWRRYTNDSYEPIWQPITWAAESRMITSKGNNKSDVLCYTAR